MLRTAAKPQLNGPAAATLNRRERSKRDKIDRITRAARRLFSRRGFDGTTTREIARAADIGIGTLFLYAVRKEDLLVLIFRDEVGRALDHAFATLPDAPILDQLLHIFRAIVDHHRADLGLARVFVKELPFVEDSRHGMREFMSILLRRIASLFDAAVARGELKRGVSCAQLAQNCFAIYFQHVQLWLGAHRPRADFREDILRDALELQLIGLRRRASGSRLGRPSHQATDSRTALAFKE